MATIQAKTMRDTVYQGTHGNVSVAVGQVSLNAAAMDDVVQLLEMPVGMRIHTVDVISDALGADVTIEIKSGQATLVPAAAHSSAVVKSVPIVPYTTADDGEIITAVIAGGAATGRLVVNVQYVAMGV